MGTQYISFLTVDIENCGEILNQSFLLNKMPRERTQQKFKCMEICCGMLIRSDKLIKHSRRKLAFKHAIKVSGHFIQYVIKLNFYLFISFVFIYLTPVQYAKLTVITV